MLTKCLMFLFYFCHIYLGVIFFISSKNPVPNCTCTCTLNCLFSFHISEVPPSSFHTGGPETPTPTVLVTKQKTADNFSTTRVILLWNDYYYTVVPVRPGFVPLCRAGCPFLLVPAQRLWLAGGRSGGGCRYSEAARARYAIEAFLPSLSPPPPSPQASLTHTHMEGVFGGQ